MQQNTKKTLVRNSKTHNYSSWQYWKHYPEASSFLDEYFYHKFMKPFQTFKAKKFSKIFTNKLLKSEK